MQEKAEKHQQMAFFGGFVIKIVYFFGSSEK